MCGERKTRKSKPKEVKRIILCFQCEDEIEEGYYAIFTDDGPIHEDCAIDYCEGLWEVKEVTEELIEEHGVNPED